MKKGEFAMLFGAHISISKGYENAVKEALSIGANTLQFFTRNPRGGAAKALDENDIKKSFELREKENFGPMVAHAPYTVNMAANKNETADFTRRVLREDLDRLEKVGAPYLVIHPGSHLGDGVEAGIERIAAVLKEVVTGRERVMVLLETMAGSGSEVGYTFEQLYDIMDKTGIPHAFGVCIDTCHLYGAGYDVKDRLDEVLAEFDRVLGLDKIKAVHLNDSKFGLASRKDRHANLGQGQLGLEAIKRVITHPALKGRAFLLETPGGMENYKKEIAILKEMSKENG
ncbi:deoxyribonuclease IV [Thermosediminibacter oceani]|nr:deoxyribonuclease IV [Thermosediminibacter oceani]